MKITAIIASPKGMSGYTARLLKPLLAAAEEAGAVTEVFELNKLRVNPCNSCQTNCHKTGECIQKDDYDQIKSAYLESDGIVLATPNFTFSVTPQLKALLDRCNLLLHCQRLNGKYGAVLVSSGGSDPAEVEEYLLKVMKSNGMWLLGSLGAVRAQLEDDDEKEKLSQAAAEIGRRMVQAIKNKQTFPEQAEEREQAFKIMKFMTQMVFEWSWVHDYWEQNWGKTEGTSEA
ncbi:MAG: flavodoxin family protein [Pseudomonadota bacterium]